VTQHHDKLAGKQATLNAQLVELHRRKALLEMERVATIDFSNTMTSLLASKQASIFVPTGGRGSPHVQIIKKKSNSFRWMEEAQKALDDHKTLISVPLILASLELGETLLLYVATTPPSHQCYPGSGAGRDRARLHGTKASVQKLLYIVLITKHKLLHHFESHLIRVVTSFGVGEIVGNHLTMGRIAKWALQLMGLDITYVSQMVIKSQALANFVAEWTET
jgi:hypothetical protein